MPESLAGMPYPGYHLLAFGVGREDLYAALADGVHSLRLLRLGIDLVLGLELAGEPETAPGFLRLRVQLAE